MSYILASIISLCVFSCDLSKESPSADGDWGADTADGPPAGMFGDDAAGSTAVLPSLSAAKFCPFLGGKVLNARF